MSLHSSPVNCVILRGYVSKAGELKRSGTGNAYLPFGLAFPEFQRDLRTGDIKEHASFIDCVLYGARAEEYAGELYKNRPVIVMGRLHWDKFIDSYHYDRSKHQIRVDRIDFRDESNLEGGVGNAS